MKRLLIAVLVILILGVLPGCADNDNRDGAVQQPPVEQNTDKNEAENGQNGSGKDRDDDRDTPGSLGGIGLNSSLSEVEEKLGKDFKETTHDEPGYFPEAWVERNYNGEFILIYGKDSKKIFELYTTSGKYPTNLGVKVGDNAKEVFDKYSQLFKQFESKQGLGLLPGFFEIGDGEIIIFDLNAEDNTLLNEEPGEDSKVEAIKITRIDYLD